MTSDISEADDLIEAKMAEIYRRVLSLEHCLPTRVEGMTSPESRLTLAVLVYRETSRWRMAELCRGAYESLRQDHLALAIVATRAATETSAALGYLSSKLHRAVEASALVEIDDVLMRMLMGVKAEPDLLQAVNVMTFVDRVEREIKGFQRNYAILSEYAHPNWAGTSHLFSKRHPENHAIELGKKNRGPVNARRIAVRGLSIALKSFERYYDGVAEVMPPFADLCAASKS